MNIIMYQVDAFTDTLFKGNPVAVCVTAGPIPVELMRNLAIENNLSETAFCYKEGEGRYHIRWFTPEVEIDLCGHATLGAAAALLGEKELGRDKLTFSIEKGEDVEVTKEGDYLVLEFPIREGKRISERSDIARALGGNPIEFYESRDVMVVYGSEKEIQELNPDVSMVNNLDAFGVIATAPGDKVDFVSRYFAPGCGVFEDPATGSSHCTLVPYWAKRLGKTEMEDIQLSPRVGSFTCVMKDNKIYVKGQAIQLFKTEFVL